MSVKNALKSIAVQAGRSGIGQRLLQKLNEPPVGSVEWSTLRRTMPVSRWFGTDRGQPIDRFYIEAFLQQYSSDIRGRVLEIADDTYSRLFGGDRVQTCDVLHAVAGNAHATIVADLTDAPQIQDNQYDCIIITQTLQMIFDVCACVRTVHRILKPGGVVLATLPGISQISRSDMDQWGDFWRFTNASATRLFRESFPDDAIDVVVYGNVLSAVSFLYGLAREDLTHSERVTHDPDYQVLIGVRAAKTAAPSAHIPSAPE